MFYINDVQRTAFIGLWRNLEYGHTPFGLHNAPDVFQSLMDRVLSVDVAVSLVEVFHVLSSAPLCSHFPILCLLSHEVVV